MTSPSRSVDRMLRARQCRRLGMASLLVLVILVKAGTAQTPPAPATEHVPPPLLKPLDPRPEATKAFLESLSGNDMMFEVVVEQGRILTTKENITVGKIPPLIAVGDPSVVDFAVVSPRQVRVIGQRIGVTDLSITTGDNRTYSFEVRVVADLEPLRARLQAAFPDARLKLSHVRDHVIIEGQARDSAQVARILETSRAYLVSVHAGQLRKIKSQQRGPGAPGGSRQPRIPDGRPGEATPPPPEGFPGAVSPEQAPATEFEATVPPPQIINLIRVPGSQQVLLKVRIAELNRTAMREIGADMLFVDPDSGTIFGTQIGGGLIGASGVIGTPGGLITNRDRARTFFDASDSTTVFGIFEGADVQFLLRALRRNSLLKILAEPNLVALNGHQAKFLAGGKFPVPVPQTSSGGAAPTVTVQFQDFGVELDFVPYVLDGERVRLKVHPQVSSVDFTLGTVLVPGGTPVPGLNSREAETTVELRQGQTLAIAGLLQLTLDGQTSRIPGLGDLPIIGPFFSNTTSGRIEKELIVLVTPYLIEPMNADQVPSLPGDEVKGPRDLELYLLNRIEGRTCREGRATTEYDDPGGLLRCLLNLQKAHVCGPYGFTD